MVSREQLADELRDAYGHLYDLVHLRTHPLTSFLVPDTTLARKEKAWRLNQILQDAIDDINPGPQAPVTSREWRRHRLMALRYGDGLDAQGVARELCISRRHYYREHQEAIDTIADLLWDRYGARQSSPVERTGGPEQQTQLSHEELLRLEAGRLAQRDRTADVASVTNGVLSLLEQMLQENRTTVRSILPRSLPAARVEPILLRQILLEVVELLVECSQGATIDLEAQSEPSGLCVKVTIDPPLTGSEGALQRVGDRFALLEEMGDPSGVGVSQVGAHKSLAGFEIHLPGVSQRTVLVVDDNEDLVELFRRYLTANGYGVLTAMTAPDALTLASQLRPYAITVDLMMPDQDGWQLLQTLRHQPETSDIPVIVCTVLRHRDLAMSLGATLFLEKPVMERTLITSLEALEGSALTNGQG